MCCMFREMFQFVGPSGGEGPDVVAFASRSPIDTVRHKLEVTSLCRYGLRNNTSE